MSLEQNLFPDEVYDVGASHGIVPHVVNIDNRSATVLICKRPLLCKTFP
jgi:hypothetical protein